MAASPRPALSGRKDFQAAAVARTSALLHSVIVWPASGAFNLPVCVCGFVCVCVLPFLTFITPNNANSELSPKIHTSASKAASWPLRVRWPFSSPVLQNLSLCWPCHLPHPSRRTQPLEHGQRSMCVHARQRLFLRLTLVSVGPPSPPPHPPPLYRASLPAGFNPCLIPKKNARPERTMSVGQPALCCVMSTGGCNHPSVLASKSGRPPSLPSPPLLLRQRQSTSPPLLPSRWTTFDRIFRARTITQRSAIVSLHCAVISPWLCISP
jgi:hypothetical protein